MSHHITRGSVAFTRGRALLAGACVAATACARAPNVGVEPLVTDRPDFTESSQTVPKGMVQFEGGSTYAHTPDERATSVGEVLLRAGVADRAEIRVGLNSYSFAQASGITARGFEDASIGAKFRLVDGGVVRSPRPTVSVIVATSVPTGSAGFRSPSLQPEMKLGAEWDFTERVAFATNLNYSWVRQRAESWAEPALSASLGVGLTEKVGSYFEYFGFYPQLSGAERAHYGNAGLTYAVNDNFQLDARVGHALTREKRGPNHFIGFGIARRW